MNYGFIYCLGNNSMPRLFKIGMTERAPQYRCDELSKSTSSPSPFEILLFVAVEKPRETERFVHEHLTQYRHSDNREFFKISDLAVVHDLFIGISDLIGISTQGGYLLAFPNGEPQS